MSRMRSDAPTRPPPAPLNKKGLFRPRPISRWPPDWPLPCRCGAMGGGVLDVVHFVRLSFWRRQPVPTVTTHCEPGQVRKEAAAAILSGAEVWLAGAATYRLRLRR
jgi:hypothetical protein